MDFESDFELVWVPDVFGLPDLLGVLRVEKEITSNKMQCQLYKQGHEIEKKKPTAPHRRVWTPMKADRERSALKMDISIIRCITHSQ